MLWWFAETSLVAGVLALVAGVAARWAPPRFGPAARHALWLVVLLKLVTPPLVRSPWAVPVPVPAPVATPAAELAVAVAVVPDGIDADDPEVAVVLPEPPGSADAPARSVAPGWLKRLMTVRHAPAKAEQAGVDIGPRREGEALTMTAGRPNAARALSPQPTGARFDGTSIRYGLLAAWGITSLGIGLVQVGRIARFARRLRSAGPAPGWLVDELDLLAQQMNVRRPEARVVAGLGVPVLWCLGRPTLLVPEHLVDTLGVDRWRGVLAHELAHLRRGDPWVGRLTLLAGLIWWWNPLYWLARRRLDAEAELACDAWVVWALPDDRLVYATTMLEICESLCRRIAPPLAPALGATARPGCSKGDSP